MSDSEDPLDILADQACSSTEDDSVLKRVDSTKLRATPLPPPLASRSATSPPPYLAASSPEPHPPTAGAPSPLSQSAAPAPRAPRPPQHHKRLKMQNAVQAWASSELPTGEDQKRLKLESAVSSWANNTPFQEEEPSPLSKSSKLKKPKKPKPDTSKSDQPKVKHPNKPSKSEHHAHKHASKAEKEERDRVAFAVAAWAESGHNDSAESLKPRGHRRNKSLGGSVGAMVGAVGAVTHLWKAAPHREREGAPGLAASGESSAIFGVPLLQSFDAAKRHGFPHPLDLFCLHLRRFTSEEGLFRLSGSSTEVQELRDIINQCRPFNLANYDVHSVAGAYKLFFRQLPESLIPSPAFRAAIQLLDTPDAERPQSILSFLQSLPPLHFQVLSSLIQFLALVAASSAINHMGPDNLAIVFAPNICHAPLDSPLEDIMRFNPFVSELISRQEYYFPNNKWSTAHAADDAPSSAPSDAPADLSLPSPLPPPLTVVSPVSSPRKSTPPVLPAPISLSLSDPSSAIRTPSPLSLSDQAASPRKPTLAIPAPLSPSDPSSKPSSPSPRIQPIPFQLPSAVISPPASPRSPPLPPPLVLSPRSDTVGSPSGVLRPVSPSPLSPRPPPLPPLSPRPSSLPPISPGGAFRSVSPSVSPRPPYLPPISPPPGDSPPPHPPSDAAPTLQNSNQY